MPELTPSLKQLVIDHLYLAEALATKHFRNMPNRPQLDELHAEANIALVEAARAWDEDRGPFAPFAAKRIRWHLVNSDYETTHPVHVPRGVHGMLRKMRAAQNGGAETPSAVAAALGVNPEKIRELWPLLSAGYSTLDTAEPIAASDVPDLQFEESDERHQVRLAVAKLPKPLRDVVAARFGFTTGLPMLTEEIAAFLRLDSAVVEEREASAMSRLRVALEESIY